MKEIWKDVKWYEWYYQASSFWRLRSITRYRKWPWWNDCIMKWIFIKQHINHYWYYNAHISRDGKSKWIIIHRIIAETFIPNIHNKRTVNHKNWIKTDNRVSNLERATYSENHKHSYDKLWRKWYRKGKSGILNKTSKQVNQYSKLWKFIRTWWSMAEAERWLWISTWLVCDVCKWYRKSAWWYIWKYFKS